MVTDSNFSVDYLADQLIYWIGQFLIDYIALPNQP